MRSLQSKPNIITPTINFPFGRIKDDSGNNDGVPIDEQVYGDFHQFFEKLMSDAGLVANGLPESEADGYQLNEALYNVAVKPSLSFLGTFSEASLLNYDYSATTAIIEAFDADQDNIYIAKLDGVNRSIDKVNIRTQISTGFAFTGTVNISEVSVDETHVWILNDGLNKEVRAFDKITGNEDLTKKVALPAGVYGGFVAGNKSGYFYVCDNTANVIRGFYKVDGSPLPTIGAGLAVMADIEFNNGRLFTVNAADSVCNIYEAYLGGLLATFTVNDTPLTTIKSIEVFAGKIYVLFGDVVSTQIHIFSADTYVRLLGQEKPLVVYAGGLRCAKIADNFLYLNNSAAVNRSDAFKQEFRY